MVNIEPTIVEISSDEEDGKRCRDWVSDLIRDFDKNVDDSSVDPYSEIAVTHKIRSSSDAKSSDKDSDDDCLILDGDPDNPVTEVNDSVSGDDLLIVGEKGQIACRDFPHPRSLCAKFPFDSTPHEKHCDLCHCYVCDSLAPCVYWFNTALSDMSHCHATHTVADWKTQRKMLKVKPKALLPVINPHNAPTFVRQPYFSPPVLNPCSSTINSRTINPAATLVFNPDHLGSPVKNPNFRYERTRTCPKPRLSQAPGPRMHHSRVISKKSYSTNPRSNNMNRIHPTGRTYGLPIPRNIIPNTIITPRLNTYPYPYPYPNPHAGSLYEGHVGDSNNEQALPQVTSDVANTYSRALDINPSVTRDLNAGCQSFYNPEDPGLGRSVSEAGNVGYNAELPDWGYEIDQWLSGDGADFSAEPTMCAEIDPAQFFLDF